MKNFKRFSTLLTLVAVAFQMMSFGFASASTLSAGSVVINEVAWAGSSDASGDEWIELYNTTSQSIDLSGWKIVDDGTSFYNITSGVITPHGYFLIEDSENSVSSFEADAVIGLSLANAGDSLVLKDDADKIMDSVNTSGGAWYAGNSTSKASMEKLDPKNLVDSAVNWATAVSSSGQNASGGSLILGTPGTSNSTYAGEGAEVSINPNAMTAEEGGKATFTVKVDGAVDLYGYGFEILYDKDILNFDSAVEGDFLKAGDDSTAFNFAKENNVEGVLVVGNARLGGSTSGVDGSGNLFTLTFDVIGQSGQSSQILFGGQNFLTDSLGDIPAKMSGATVTLALNQSLAVNNLVTANGSDRYSLKLSWNGEQAEGISYVIKRKIFDGSFQTIGTTTDNFFVDSNNIVPNLEYEYQVIVLKNGISGVAVLTSGIDVRGIVGDFDRSDRVDGRDVEKLARAYGSEYGDEEYSELFDVNHDGAVDGIDLISLGANFGSTY